MGLGFGVATPALELGLRAKGLSRAPAGAAEAAAASSAGIEAGVTLPPLGLGPPVGLATGGGAGGAGWAAALEGSAGFVGGG